MDLIDDVGKFYVCFVIFYDFFCCDGIFWEYFIIVWSEVEVFEIYVWIGIVNLRDFEVRFEFFDEIDVCVRVRCDVYLW